MSNRTLIYTAAIAVQVLLAAGQIMLKTFAGRLAVAKWAALKDISIFLYVALPVSIAAVIYIATAGLWVFVLQNLPVSRAFLFVALSFVFVPIFSHFILGEVVSFGILLGTALIIAGILIGILL